MTNGTEHMGVEPRGRPQSTGDLISSALMQVSALLRSELDLARAELDRSATRAAYGLAFILVGAVVAICALLALTAALIGALTVLLANTAYPMVFASLIVGAVYGIAAAIFVRAGISRLRMMSLAPRRTVENIKKDADLLKGTLQ